MAESLSHSLHLKKIILLHFFPFPICIKDIHPLEETNVICLKMIRHGLTTKLKVQIMKGEEKLHTAHNCSTIYYTKISRYILLYESKFLILGAHNGSQSAVQFLLWPSKMLLTLSLNTSIFNC